MMSRQWDEMQERQKRMAPDHSGTGITHDVNDTRTHVGFIAVDRTFQAGGFFSLKGTMRLALTRIRL